jgi:photosystem II stability/assembly factor-like uncharacterized protein
VAGALNRGRAWTAAVAAALVAGCGGGPDPAAVAGPAAAWVDPAGEEPLIGSIAVDPGDRSVWLSTNRGLYRLGRDRPQRVTGALRTPQGSGRISAQLVVGFAGPGRLVASGHPDSGSALPPVLGLIDSDDGGRTWRSVSELGAADFHAIETSGRRIVAAQYGEAAILFSDDNGRTWRGRSAPATVVDLAVDPAGGRRWVATTADGVFASRDAGQTWRPVDDAPNGRLAWDPGGAVYRMDPEAEVLRSTDGGWSWTRVGTGAPQPQALTSAGRGALVAATGDGTVTRSADGGRTWARVAGPAG